MKTISIIMMALILSGGAPAQTSQVCTTCLPEGIWFSTQMQIDSFSVNYPGCSGIEGFVVINGNDISNLNGLASITNIAGSLSIYSNDDLTRLTPLKNLRSNGGHLCIYNNKKLNSLIGLDNIHYQSINDLIILDNESLFQCAIASVCAYLSVPYGWIQIGYNAPGCNSRQEVETACEKGIRDSAISSQQTQSIPSPNHVSIQLR